MTSLKKFTNYSVAIVGFTSKGDGNVSHQFVVSTDEDGQYVAKCLLNLMVTLAASNLRREVEFHLNKSPLTEPNSIIDCVLKSIFFVNFCAICSPSVCVSNTTSLDFCESHQMILYPESCSFYLKRVVRTISRGCF